MDFSFNEEQQAIYELARRFADEELAPGYQKRDINAAMDIELRKKLGSLGLIGAEFPEQYGGSGLDYITTGRIIEAISHGDFNVGYLVLLASLNGQIILDYASHELCSEWLPRLCSGESVCALALTEPSCGSDAANLKLSARRDGDHYILNGEKTSISMADQADISVLFARTGTAESRAHGISAFLLPMDLDGITTTRFDDCGEHAIGRGSIFCDNVRLPASYLLSEENRGFTSVMQGFDFSRALIGLQCLGIAQQALDETWRYIQERQAFNKPLSDFQGVTFPLAEHETYVTAARELCYKSLWLKAEGLPHTA